ncbi:MAG: methylmalonyl Co-A mutase-associated GTPase MeaB [Longimicrobiales bacterium]|nr:methylmalonyl Co-A mutase-associated GTPase MeaB [Longimicrobiales bacterium]
MTRRGSDTMVSNALNPAVAQTLERFREGKTLALARAISIVENEREGFQELLHTVMETGPKAMRVGLTGPPGAGKSSLVAAIATAYRAAEEHVGVVAVDPTSPYSGGALLGDRIRMNDIATDPGIFIRSMATRGSLGGLATTTKEVVDLMDAFGFDRVLVETVGVGQTELEVTAAADTVVVVLVPESGDAIQAMKAGLMEIADIFVVNKADRPGAPKLVKELRQALHLRAGSAMRDVPAHHGVDLSRVLKKEQDTDAPAPEPNGWEIPVLTTTALTEDGVPKLLETIESHRMFLTESGQLASRRRERAAIRIRDVVDRELRRVAWRSPEATVLLESGVERIASGTGTPYSAAREILETLLR